MPRGVASRLIERLIEIGWVKSPDSATIARFVIPGIGLRLTALQDPHSDFVTISWLEGRAPGKRQLYDCMAVEDVQFLIRHLTHLHGDAWRV